MPDPNITVVMTANEKALLNAVNKADARIKKLEGGLKRAGRAGEGAFGKKMRQNLRLVAGAAGVGSIAVAVTKVIGLFDKLKQRARASAEEILGTEASLKRLLQISKGDPDVFRRFISGAEAAARETGIQPTAATEAKFRAASVGFTDAQFREIARTQDITHRPQVVINALAGVRKQFGPEVLGGSIESFTNTVLTAAAPSLAGFEEITGNFLTFGEILKQQGGNAKEGFAALGALAVSLKDITEASTVIKAIAFDMQKDRRTRGLGLIGGARVAAGLSDAQRRQLFTNKRSAVGLGLILQNLDLPVDEGGIASLSALIGEEIGRTGTPESLIRRVLKSREDLPTLQLIKGFQKSKAGLAITERRFRGADELAIQGIVNLLREQLLLAGKSGAAAEFEIGIVELINKIGRDPRTAMGAAALQLREATVPLAPMGPRGGPIFLSEAQQAVRGEEEAIVNRFLEAASKLVEAAEAIKAAAPSSQTLGVPPSGDNGREEKVGG